MPTQKPQGVSSKEKKELLGPILKKKKPHLAEVNFLRMAVLSVAE